jgi:3',5'-cyclic AMP phosphodiesterase CpdA
MVRVAWIGVVSCTLALACTAEAHETDDDTGGGSTSNDAGTGGSESDTDGTGSTGDAMLPDPLPPLGSAPSTVDQTIVPTHAIDVDPAFDPRIPGDRQQMLDQGYDAFEVGAGEPVLARTPDGSDPPAPGAAPARLTRFVHLADTQLADDESPLRVVEIDNPSLSGAFRPQEDFGCQVVNAAVRTVNAVNADDPIDFVVLGGDNIDNAQTNEVQWFLGILDGAPVVNCDSGADDDPEPGEDNDSKDPFAPVGLDVPWIWVTGNHDALVQGNFTIADRLETAIGDAIGPGGSTRDWTLPGGPAFEGPVVADPERALLDGPTLLGLVAASGDGHGLTQQTVDSGHATYGWDVPGSDLRMVVVNTAAVTGAENGVVTDADVADRIRPLLDQAEADGKLVIVSTHHASTSLSDGGGLGGTVQDGALNPEDWQDLLGEYPNVIAHLAGHSHEHRVAFIEPLGGGGYWEIKTSAVADFPNQMRILEVHDQDNGWLTITTVALDFATEGDALAQSARGLEIMDLTSGWTKSDAPGTPEDRNVQLWIPAPS